MNKPDIRVVREGGPNQEDLSVQTAPVQRPRASRQRALFRLERDRARGYSINVKQVVLAFAVEFWIIGLIVVGTYLLIAESESVTPEAIFSALLFPAALAMVELARVPLAIAVRTQDTWHVKMLAAAGVLAAITVTSFSLSQIAWKTFDNRIAEATRAGDRVKEIKARKETLQDQIAQAQAEVDQKLKARASASDRLAALEAQVTKVSTAVGQACKPTLGPDGKPLIGEDGKPIQSCAPSANVNRAQLDLVRTQMSAAKKDLDAADTTVKLAQDESKKLDPRSIEEELARAVADYRRVVNKSQLHSYTAMVTGKEVSAVTESDVKTLEKYLIMIPAIAAALASTLIAITAVRRIPPERVRPATTLPDDAASYLFGPLVAAIQAEARSAVDAAVSARPRTASPPAA